MESKVSVIIPVYNVEEYLAECLDSILIQTYATMEVICVNDGSTDNSSAILQEYAHKDSRILVIDKENGGQSSARNAGLRQASGEYVLFVDADDYLRNKDVVAELCCFADENTSDVLLFGADSFVDGGKGDLNSNCPAYERPDIIDEPKRGMEALKRLLDTTGFLASPCMMLIRRGLMSEGEIEFYEGIIQEDNLFTYDIFLNAHRIFSLNKKYYMRRMRADSTMQTKKNYRHCLGYYVCYREILNHSEKRALSRDEWDSVERLLNNLLFNVGNIYVSLDKEQKNSMMEALNDKERVFFKTVMAPAFETIVYNRIADTKSYKLGCALTALPRAMKKKGKDK